MNKYESNLISILLQIPVSFIMVPVNFKPDHPPDDPGDSHIPVAPGVGLSLSCLARGSAWGGEGGLNQNKNSIFLKRSDFCLVT